ncbi:hypothetical protein HPB48_012219 [Haemaphysalis longicornis]|uniref:Orn/DAP/Arg decarboxylase 2 C-terminal domain-containing protein n=1 Tax=Haemaphysalis longicornis TaxID=44386 RepID=A0A9J6FYK5_HAELO|nr:hypothetical protein HPB48_012219 [Haemaphysalis longicornis]
MTTQPPYQRQRQSLTSLWGSTCYPLDLFEDAVPFFELSVGDWLLMDNVGAYGLVKACGFNGTGFPAVHYRTEPEDMARICQIIASSAVKPGYSQPAEALKSGASLDAKLSSNISASCLSCGSEHNGVLAHQNNSTAQPCL